MNGWWKCHRKMTEHAVWSLSDSQFKVWITILMYANHKDQDWWNGTERVVVPSGSFVTSQDHLAALSHTSRKTVRLAIDALIRIGSIWANPRAKRYTEIGLVNSEKYRGTDIEEGQQEGQVGAKQGPSEGQVGAITGEYKKVRRKERILLANPDGFAAFWTVYPKKLGKEQSKKAWNKIAPENGLVETIVGSVKAHMNTEQWKDYAYIPYPATFLNGRRWEDVLVMSSMISPTPVDPKIHWKSREDYLAARQAGRVAPSRRVPEWEPTTVSH